MNTNKLQIAGLKAVNDPSTKNLKDLCKELEQIPIIKVITKPLSFYQIKERMVKGVLTVGVSITLEDLGEESCSPREKFSEIITGSSLLFEDVTLTPVGIDGKKVVIKVVAMIDDATLEEFIRDDESKD
jgi:hypothetical protein